MSQPFDIERATIANIDIIAPLFDRYRQFYKQDPDLAGAQAFLQARLKGDDSVVFMAVSEGTALGFTQLYPTYSSVAMRPMWILNDLFVAPEFRRQGIAGALLKRAARFGEETGACVLELETATDNFPAQALYESLGWVRISNRYRFYLPLP